MNHIYVVVTAPNIEEAIIKGRTDYEQPQFNVSQRFSLDGRKLLLEGLFGDDEIAWFKEHVIFIGNLEQIRQYLSDNKEEWESEELPN